MNISYGVPVLAPLVTGHPAALPADPPPQRPDREVAPAGENSGASGTGTNSEHKSAPPSAMQLKIMELLERQAKELDAA